ncbi:cerebellin-3-like [Saccostrea echinata]|uniref:cerebellin-3-like n=1 Tax=Saccostrea echinata TaxID=191078 RepID=UPI002A8067EE|nr:cerebellin-3-like [Saccostrea echinata]
MRQEQQIRDIQNENQALKAIIRRQEREIRELRLENKVLRNDVDDLQTSLFVTTNLDEPIGAFKDKNVSKEKEENIPSSEPGQIEMIESSGKSSSMSKGKRQIGSGTPIAFYAYMSKSEHNPSNHHMLIFDTIKTNLGGGYNRHSGMFSAPVAGLYVFTWTIYTGEHGKTAFAIYVNDDIVSSCFGETDGNSRDYDSETGTIVVPLNQHDDVYIRSVMACTTYIPSIDWHARTTFAGWKLD